MTTCKQCGEEKQTGLECKPCDVKRKKAYYLANKEKIKAYNQANAEKISARHKAYLNANAERLKEQRKAHRKANPEKFKAIEQERYYKDPEAARKRTEEYYARNAEKCRQAQRDRYQKNPEAHKAAVKAWQTAHPDYVKAKRSENYKAYCKTLLPRLKKEREELQDRYLVSLLRLAGHDIPDWLIKLKRDQITIRRMAKQMKQEAKNESSTNTSGISG